MAKFGLIKWVGKALGCIALPLACALFAIYAKHHLPFWAFGLSLLMVVAGSVPAVLFSTCSETTALKFQASALNSASNRMNGMTCSAHGTATTIAIN